MQGMEWKEGSSSKGGFGDVPFTYPVFQTAELNLRDVYAEFKAKDIVGSVGDFCDMLTSALKLQCNQRLTNSADVRKALSAKRERAEHDRFTTSLIAHGLTTDEAEEVYAKGKGK